MAIVATLCLVAACALPPAASAAALLVACEAAFTCATTVMMWPSSGKAVAFFVARVTFSATLWLLATTCRLAGLCCQLAGRFWLVCCTSECTLVRRLRMLVVAVVVAISTHQRASGRFPRAVVSCAACVGIALLALLPAVVSALWAVTLFTQVVWLVVTMWRYGGALLVGRAPLSLHYAVTVLGAAWLLCAALAACACCFLDVKLARHCGMGWTSFSLTVATVVPGMVALLRPSLGRDGVVWCVVATLPRGCPLHYAMHRSRLCTYPPGDD
jgi:hypothetical protein